MKMCKTSWFLLHSIAALSIATAACYIYLNETDQLEKVKRQCYNKTMDMKDRIKKKLKS